MHEGGGRWVGSNKLVELKKKKKALAGNSLTVQWLGLCTSTAEGTSLFLGQGTKILHALAWL